MIKEYIEDKLRTNRLQFEILDREYQTIRKSEGEINEHIKRLQEDDDIDFVIFSPRSLKYSTKNSIVEYDRKLQDLVQERETVKGKMNRLLEQRMELDKMFQEAEEKQLESEIVEVTGHNHNIKNDVKIDNKGKVEDKEKTENKEKIENKEDRETSVESGQNIDEKKIKNWNENGTIKIKTNGNTGKFFDALAHKKGSTSSRVVRTGLNPNLKMDYNSESSRDRREIKNVFDKKSLYNSLENKVLDGNRNLDENKLINSNKNKVEENTPVHFINIVEGKSIDDVEPANNIDSRNNMKESSNVIESESGSHFINIMEGADKKNSVLDKEENEVINFGAATDSSLENKFLCSRSTGRKTGDKVIRSDDMQKLLSKIELCQKLLLTNKEECNVELKNLKYVLENLV